MHKIDDFLSDRCDDDDDRFRRGRRMTSGVGLGRRSGAPTGFVNIPPSSPTKLLLISLLVSFGFLGSYNIYVSWLVPKLNTIQKYGAMKQNNSNDDNNDYEQMAAETVRRFSISAEAWADDDNTDDRQKSNNKHNVTSDKLPQQAPTPTPKTPRILVFITTIFSDSHIQYLYCCWPKLLRSSKLFQRQDTHFMIFSNNETVVEQTVIRRVQNIFDFYDNTLSQPKFTMKFASHDDLATLRYYPKRNSSSSSTPVSRRNTTTKVKNPTQDHDEWEYFFQSGANLGLKLGFEHGWFSETYDWMIRLNPDVLIRNSSWLLETMSDRVNAVDGIFVECDNPNLPHKLHTDFFAVRPKYYKDPIYSNRIMMMTATDKTVQYPPFSVMTTHGVGKKKHLVNHEMTATTYFLPIIEAKRYKYLPDTSPSNGKCRVRGNQSSVYHQHDLQVVRQRASRQRRQNCVCNALEGWTIT